MNYNVKAFEYVKGAKRAYFSDENLDIVKSDFSDTFQFINKIIEQRHIDCSEVLYFIFYDDGFCSAGIVPLERLDKINILTEDDLIIKDIIE